MTNRPKILFTAELSENLLEYAESNGLDVDVIPMIETVSILDSELNQKIKNLAREHILAIFTSQTSLTIISDALEGIAPSWIIACTAPNTSEQANLIFGRNHIIAEGNNAIELANKLVDTIIEVDKVIFFSGTDRKDDLPSILKHHFKNQWNEIFLYKTRKKILALKNSYDGMAFCSPSAVEAFFEENQLNPAIKFFAIGQSTANKLMEKGIRDVIISDIPDKNRLMTVIKNTFN